MPADGGESRPVPLLKLAENEVGRRIDVTSRGIDRVEEPGDNKADRFAFRVIDLELINRISYSLSAGPVSY